MVASRSVKAVGARSSNRAASQDLHKTAMKALDQVRFTMLCLCHSAANLTLKLNNLTARIGAHSCAFIVPGHMDDTSQPEFISTGNTRFFWTQSLGHEPLDVLRLLKSWTQSTLPSKFACFCVV